MKKNFTVKQIGKIRADKQGFRLEIDAEYRPALEGLEGFSHINILWWFSRCDDELCRGNLIEKSPYTKGPETLGTFATRSPLRPNPLALTCAYVTYIDIPNGVIGLAFIDAEDESPVLDIKPYTPSVDRVGQPSVPQWCAHWPKDVEGSAEFDWASEFNF